MSVFDPLWALVGYGFLALLFVTGLYFVRESVGLFRDVAAMALTRTSRIGDVREGRVEVSGTVRLTDRTLTDPVSGEESVAYEYNVSPGRKDDLINYTRFGTLAAGDIAVPFYVEDESGEVRIEPGTLDDGPEVHDGSVNLYATRDEAQRAINRDERLPSPFRNALDRFSISSPEDFTGLFETTRVEPGDEVYVLGTASFRDGERVVAGGDGRFVVAGASQLRTLVHNAGWGLWKFVGGTMLVAVCGFVLLAVFADFAGVSFGFV